MSVWQIVRSRKVYLFVPPVLIGLAAVGLAVANRSAPEPGRPAEIARTLGVTPAERRAVIPTVVGYGTAAPARTWRAVSEVGGRVVHAHPRLDPGAGVAADELLVRIDATDYELTVARLQAEAESLEAQIREAEAATENDRATLAIEQKSLALAERELARLKGLAGNMAIAPTEVDAQDRAVLTQQRQARELQNSLNLAPAKVARLRAELAATSKRIAAADRDIDRTEISSPFDARLAAVAIEPGQYVAPGQELFTVHGTDAAEVEARIPLDDLRRLGPDNYDGPTAIDGLFRGVAATVRVRSGAFVQEWPGEPVRLRERVDPRTRTVGVVVRVDLRTGPPLLEGTFCEVEFRGQPRPGRLVVPRTAVRAGGLFVINADGRLDRRAVRVDLALGDDLAVSGELAEGDRVVVSDPTPAVVGMLVDPVPTGSAGTPANAEESR